MVEKYLIIEGGRNTEHGDLRVSFTDLIQKALSSSRPRIKMGNGKDQAIDLFRNYIKKTKCYLLIDLDGGEKTRNLDLTKYKLTDFSELVYYMIQEMEAWFFSQPDVIKRYYGADVPKQMLNIHPSQIPRPDVELEKIAKKSKHPSRKKYGKIEDGGNLLEMLDPVKLQQDFPDFKRLIENLKKN